MDVTLLRKLARKSLMNFGRYEYMTVQNLLDLRKTRYLRWCYFNCSMITFTDDIIKEIRIPDEYIIKKPGKKPEYDEIINNLNKEKMEWLSIKKQESRTKRIRKSNLVNFKKVDQIKYSKGNLQSRNHGH